MTMRTKRVDCIAIISLFFAFPFEDFASNIDKSSDHVPAADCDMSKETSLRQ
jgi:hypothetical protein